MSGPSNKPAANAPGSSAAATPAAPATPAATPAAAAAPAVPAAPATAITAEPVKAEAKPAEGTPNPDPAKPEDKKPADPAAKADDPAKPAANEPVVPEKYDLKIPENSLLDAAHVDAVSSFAKENKLTNEQAQVILEREHNAAQAGVDAFKNKGQQLSEKWLEQAQADKEIGGDNFKTTVALAKSALDKLFPSMEINQIMNDSGLGNHPAVLKGFAQIGKMLANDKMHQPGAQPAPKLPMTKRLYDNPTSPGNQKS